MIDLKIVKTGNEKRSGRILIFRESGLLDFQSCLRRISMLILADSENYLHGVTVK
jgi:hypothetical protein